MKKFELTSEFITNTFGTKLFRIKALGSFGNVSEGDIGGYIEKEENLSHCGDAWVYGDAQVYGNKGYSCANGFGRYGRNTTFFRTRDGGVTVSCGCFTGTIAEFRDKVKETHKDTKLAKEYLMLADLMEYHFSKEDEK